MNRKQLPYVIICLDGWHDRGLDGCYLGPMESENIRDRACITVSGRVQGVGYRWLVKTAADAAGIVGTVRNLADGSVEIVAEAEQEILTVFVGTV